MIMKNDKRVVEVFKGNVEICTIKHGIDTVFNNTSEYTGTLPVTINSVRAENLKSYNFSGNTVQNGTPAPDAPIAVNGVGNLVESGEHAGQYDIPIILNGTATATIYLDKPLYGTGTNLDYLQRLADGSGVEHRAWGVCVFDGTENISILRVVDNRNVYRLPIDGIVASEKAAGTYSIKSTHFNSELFADIYAGRLYGIAPHDLQPTSNVYVCTDAVDTLEELKTYLAAQYAAGTPVTVVYPLATPTEETITAPPLMLSKGTNIIDVDTTVSPTSAYLRWKGYK